MIWLLPVCPPGVTTTIRTEIFDEFSPEFGTKLAGGITVN